MMPRVKKYRVFVVGAVVILFLLYRVSENSGWENSAASSWLDSNSFSPGAQTEAGYDTSEKPIPHGPIGDGKTGQPAAVAEPEKVAALPETAPVPAPTPAGRPDVDGEDAAPLYPPEPTEQPPAWPDEAGPGPEETPTQTKTVIHWTQLPEHFPVPAESLIALPTGKPKTIPAIQYAFAPETESARSERESRLGQVKAEMKRTWTGYHTYAWGHDELKPVSNGYKDPFGGWGATLVDSLDTLWIMGMRDEFDEAVEAVRSIDFTTTPNRDDIPVFETTIRYLGGLIAAFDLSGGRGGQYPVLLDKAIELAEILMSVFDTPNRMPVLYYRWQPAYASQAKVADTNSGVAELGTLSMEFTRLAQLTGETKYYDAVARITDALDELQNREGGTALPGIFPMNLDASGCNLTKDTSPSLDDASSRAQAQVFEDGSAAPPEGYVPGRAAATQDVRPDRLGKRAGGPLKADGTEADWDCRPQPLLATSPTRQSFSMGGSQDSAYEYFSKQYLLLGGLEPKYQSMHEQTVEAVKKYLLFRPMIPDERRDIRFSARVVTRGRTDEYLSYTYETTHLTCFLGGMFAQGGRMFDRPEDVEIGAKLADGCVWAYEVMPSGIMLEEAELVPCEDPSDCPWSEERWRKSYMKEGLEQGFTQVNNKHYNLRPEAIESVWYLYRITGDPVWQERGWRMFTAIVAAARTPSGASAVADVTDPDLGNGEAGKGRLLLDKMESFWPAETLKYFFLLYSTPDVVSLDEWVLNTEAHPFRRPT